MAPLDLPPNRALDAAAAYQFRQVLQAYESKEYKRGIKLADAILKRFPTHGETLAMKGLITYNTGAKDEGWELVKKGLRHDIKSHVAWHVYGLMHRAERAWEEAMKAYVNALRFEPEQQVILRDLANIQAQLRVYPGLVETRKALLKRTPDDRSATTALAVAYHLAGDPKAADRVLEAFETDKLLVKPRNSPEHSMVTLYHNTVIAATGDIDRALTHLNLTGGAILDKLELKERRAKYALALGRYEDAQKYYLSLLDINPDCYAYFRGYTAARQISNTDQDALLAVYKELQKKYPRSTAVKRLPLDFLTGEKFVEAADAYLRGRLQKGVPSTFVDVKALYTSEEKANTIEKLVLGYLAVLEHDQDAPLQTLTPNGTKRDAPTAYLWTLYLLAQHYDYTRALPRALELIDRAISHTPTLVELHMGRARILKHLGKVGEAADAMNAARELDLQDRHVNTKSTKYFLRADANGEAIQTISLFVNTTLGGGAIGDLAEMQSLNFLLEDGISWARQGLIGLALKRFHQVKKAVDLWADDQYDFHAYCFRKSTLDAYVDMLKWADNSLYGNVQYRRCVRAAVSILIALHRDPSLNTGFPPDSPTATDADRKKDRKRIQKIRARVSKDATREPDKKPEKDTNADYVRKPDLDPLGDTLLQDKQPLQTALTYITPLRAALPTDVEAVCLEADVRLCLGEFGKVFGLLESVAEEVDGDVWITPRAVALWCAVTDEGTITRSDVERAFFGGHPPSTDFQITNLLSITAYLDILNTLDASTIPPSHEQAILNVLTNTRKLSYHDSLAIVNRLVAVDAEVGGRVKDGLNERWRP
ncbi:hypothetical protein PYCC9005_005522 [Savitreella phatthalungensis]